MQRLSQTRRKNFRPEASTQYEGRGAPTVALCGGTAHLHQLDAFLADRTGLEVAPLRPVGGELGASLVASGDPLRFAPALALALRASSQARTSTNLRKDDLAHRVDLRSVGREFRSTALLALGAVLLASAGTTTHIVLSNQRGAAIEREASGLYEQAFPGRAAPSNVLSAMQQAVGEAQDRADTLGVYRGNLSALDVLTEISARVPAGLAVVFEEVAIDRQVVQIKGHSPSFGGVDKLRAELAKYEPFSEITVGDITSDAKRGGHRRLRPAGIWRAVFAGIVAHHPKSFAE